MSRRCERQQQGYYRLFPVPGTRFSTEMLDELARTPVERSGVSDIPAGYTYFGQFIAHDLSHLGTTDEIPGPGPVATSELVQFNTPSLDLDAVYGSEKGFGPSIPTRNGCFASPFRREINGRQLIYDIPRDKQHTHESLLIGDKRNDENYLVAQIHVLFMNLHNLLLGEYAGSMDEQTAFSQARRETSLLYQHAIVNDFLRRILHSRVYSNLFLKKGVERLSPATASGKSAIPIEFSAAAMRFGHSIVRPFYRISGSHPPLGLQRLMALTGAGGDWSSIGQEKLFVDWERLFDMTAYGGEPIYDRTLKIDGALTTGLGDLRNEKSGNRHLAQRNLRRGLELDLPCAQDLVRWISSKRPAYAEAMGLELVNPLQIRHPQFTPLVKKWRLDTKLPLWTYILIEPMFNSHQDKNRLGVLGSIIVGEVFRNLLTASRLSIIHDSLSLADSRFLNEMSHRYGSDRVSPATLGMADLIAFTYGTSEPVHDNRGTVKAGVNVTTTEGVT